MDGPAAGLCGILGSIRRFPPLPLDDGRGEARGPPCHLSSVGLVWARGPSVSGGGGGLRPLAHTSPTEERWQGGPRASPRPSSRGRGGKRRIEPRMPHSPAAGPSIAGHPSLRIVSVASRPSPGRGGVAVRMLGPAKRLTVYLGESDHWQGRPLHSALLETLRQGGLAGATVMRAIAGFGAHSRIHTAAILRLSEDLPLVLQLVDTAERVDHALALIGPMIREGLITVEDVSIVKYSHRYLAPLPADRPVRELMSKPAVAIAAGAAILEAWDLMLRHGLKALPVVDEGGRPVGLLSDGDLMERTGLVHRLAIAERLDAATLAAWRQGLAALTSRAGDVMTRPAEVVAEDSSLGRAAALMSEHGRKRLPVVDRTGVLVGMLSRFDVLAAISPAQKGQREQPPDRK